MSGSLDDVVSIKVFPGIGIARVGNSSEFYIGPEAPGQIPDPGGRYKDGDGAMKPQAARYRVFGFDSEGGVVAELNAENAVVDWTVHVRNMKAANYAFRGRYLFDPNLLRNPNIQSDMAPVERDKLIIDPGPKRISGVCQPSVALDGGSIFNDVDPAGQGLPVPRILPFASEPAPDPNDPDMVLVKYHGANVDLGRLETDEVGRLIFVPGLGKSASCTEPEICIHQGGKTTDPITGQYSYFNVPGWYDDTCGGSIEASVTLETASESRTLSTDGDPLKRGWVSVAPPKYSPTTYNLVSLLDLQINLFPEEDPAGDQTDPNNSTWVEFYRDIFPILRTATHYGWTSAMAFSPHGPDNEPGDFLSLEVLAKIADPINPEGTPYRQQIWSILRHGESDNVPPPPAPAPWPIQPATQPQQSFRMPKLWGSGGEPIQNTRLGLDAPNQFLSLTRQQLARFKKWADGDFITGEPVESVPLETLPLAEQPRALNFAALEPTVGGGFHPGIEITYISTFPEWFKGPFRVTDKVSGLTVEPGQVNGFMAIPWQGDFWSCNTMWWPAQRPEIVVEVDERGRRTPLYWFRGHGIPDDASAKDDYAEGYNIMVHIWPKLGVIMPAEGESIGGEAVLKEYERDQSLDESLDLPPGSPCVPPWQPSE